MHSTSVNTQRLVATVAGKYVISGTVQWTANATGYRQVYIRLNGTTPLASVINPVNSAAITTTRPSPPTGLWPSTTYWRT